LGGRDGGNQDGKKKREKVFERAIEFHEINAET
jgi:hypothetical protein